MLGKFTNYFKNALMEHAFGIDEYTAPTEVYIGLSTTAISETVPPSEPVGDGYARVELANDDTVWSLVTFGNIRNLDHITFPEAEGHWGTISHFFIADDDSAGNILVYGALNSSKSIQSGETAVISINDLSIALV